MASQPKKIKLVAPSQPDPFSVVHSDIHDLVIQHFKFKDIKQLTTVSKGWNRIIGGSSAAMKRIVLKVHVVSSKKPSRSEVTALLKSDRKYQNMDVHLKFATNLERKLMLLSKFSSSLVSLQIQGYAFDLETNLLENFPKLESLSAAPITVTVAMKFIKDASKLQSLSIDLIRPHEINEEFIEMLTKKKTLKQLALRKIHEDFFSSASFRKPEFKLTSLTINHRMNYLNHISDIPRHNVNAFVLAMADTLTSLDICYFQAVDALLIQKLPALKSLKIGWHQVQRSLASYKPNTSIEVLNFDGISSTPSAFLKSFKNVRSMRISFISKDDFKKILECRPGLLKLEVGNGWMNKQDLEDVYKEVRSVEPSSVESLEVKVGNMKPFVLKM
jgi:hypothetical protein